MARINLLPWREAERKRRQQEFAVAAGFSLGVAVLLALATHWHVEGLIEAQRGRNQFLQTEIAALDVKIKKIKDLETTKANLIARMNIIQQLQESRPGVVHLFDELVVTIPDGVYLTRVEQSGRSVIVDGQAQSNARVSALMRNIEASAWIGSPSLQLIENKDQTGTGLSRFRLRFDQRQGPSAEVSAPAGAQVKPAGTATAKPIEPQKPT
ncbi:MAG TPA: PilN domain-containing protein [Chromatiaceae bacterium]|nr:PilN domain-containing protein [Chromatiaceae bacterium]